MINNKRVILHLARWYPTKFHELNGIFIKNHALSVSELTTSWILHVHSDPQTNQFIFDFNKTGTLNELIVYFPRKNIIINSVNYYRAINKGFNLITQKAGKIQIIHVHVLTRIALYALYQKLKNRIPYIISEHWTRYLPENNIFNGFFRTKITKYIVKKAAFVLPVTQHLATNMQKHQLHHKNYIVVNNTVDTNIFKPLTEPITSNYFIHVSNFNNHHKNTQGLLRAFKKFSDLYPQYQLVMVGDGNFRPQAENMAKQLQIPEQNIYFTGIKRNSELSRIFAEAIALVLFSNYENFPVVIAESLACGTPVIATCVGGISEHLTPDLGILIKSGDEAALTNALIDMTLNYNKYNKAQLVSYAEKNFGSEQIGLKLYEIYNSIQ